jgi:hypothetical protein
MPVGIGATKRRGGAWIGAEVQQHERRRSPCRPVLYAGHRADETPQPGCCGVRDSHCLIARTRNNRNRNKSCNPPPVAPMVELGDIVGTHDPDESPFGITPDERSERVRSVAGAHLLFDVTGADDAALRHVARGRKAGGIGCHALDRFEWVAWRHQPPDIVQPHRLGDEQADSAMPAMRRIERSAEKAGVGQSSVAQSSRT